MKQFNISEWLKNKSRKVVTRDGRPVRIVCWDKENASSPIVFLIKDSEQGCSYEYINCANIEGKADSGLGSDDLFFADEEDGLIEFDYAVLSIISDHNSHKDSIEAFTKRSSKKLLDLARKEILKDLPKWKKCVGSTGPFIDDFRGEDYLYLKDYVIKVSELFEKLPKEE